MQIKIINKSQHPLPNYETNASAGMDLRANLSEPIELKILKDSPKYVPNIITQLEYIRQKRNNVEYIKEIEDMLKDPNINSTQKKALEMILKRETAGKKEKKA